ncbi:hypothetical protein XIS1_600109 [Xenorhabdus innexi]|uniref:Uncharacterized protein n=1 Tax=Xenorhabdus innexi TaxID=290109 RepID=A0A1N6MZP5_9GAMM|nr:hypothetical protein XIS1_600109 [Xenorhabdus innexi]
MMKQVNGIASFTNVSVFIEVGYCDEHEEMLAEIVVENKTSYL